MSERLHYWSMIKGVAILAVLAIHIPLTSDTDSVLASRQIINFPVALFFFVSGYFVKSSQNVRESVRRLLYPYLIWSAISMIITPPPHLSLIGLAKCIINLMTGSYSILYFLFVLIQLKILTPWLYDRINKDGYNLRKDAIWIVTPAWLLLFSIIRLLWGADFETYNRFIPFDHFFPAWLIYYYLGMFCRKGDYKVKPVFLIIALIASYYISIITAYWLHDTSTIYVFGFTQSKLTSMCIALCVIGLFYTMRDIGMKRNVLSSIGEYSFGIYLLHMPVLYLIQGLTGNEHMKTLSEWFCIPAIKYVLVFSITFSFILLMKRILTKNMIRTIGLQ